MERIFKTNLFTGKIGFLINMLIIFACLIIKTFAYEIIRVQDFFDKFYDRKVTNFHVCQWQYYDENALKEHENEIFQFNFYHPTLAKDQLKSFKKLFKENMKYTSEFDNFCKNIYHCGAYYIKDGEIRYKTLSPWFSGESRRINYFTFMQNSWQYNCHSFFAFQSSDDKEFSKIAYKRNQIFYNNIEENFYLSQKSNDGNLFFLRKAPLLFIRNQKNFLIRASDMKLFTNLNLDMKNAILYSSMFSSKSALIKLPQIQNIFFNDTIIETPNQRFSNSKLIYDSDPKYPQEALDSTDAAALQALVDDFKKNMLSFPDFFMNVNYNTIESDVKYQTVLLLETYVQKLKIFQEKFFNKILVSKKDLYEVLNTDKNISDSDAENTVLSFKNYFDVFLIFSNNDKRFDPYVSSNEVKSLTLEVALNSTSNDTELALVVNKTNLYYYKFLTVGIFLKNTVDENDFIHFPIASLTTSNLFNSFSSDNVYRIKADEVDTDRVDIFSTNVFSNSFWFNFQDPNLSNNILIIKDYITFYSSEGQYGISGAKATLEISALNKTDSSSTSNQMYLRVSLEESLGITNLIPRKSFEILYTEENFNKYGKWNHICIFLYVYYEAIYNDPNKSYKNVMVYDIILNDYRYQLNTDIYDMGENFKTELTSVNPYDPKKKINKINIIRRYNKKTQSLLLSDFKFIKFSMLMQLNSPFSKNIFSEFYPKEIMRNLFIPTKYYRFSYSGINSKIITALSNPDLIKLNTLKDNLEFVTPSKLSLNFLENYQFEPFVNYEAEKNYNKIFQVGFPKLKIYEDLVGIKILFDGDFIIKSYQKAFFNQYNNFTLFSSENQSLDYYIPYMELKVLDSENKISFSKKLNFIDLQDEFDAYFPSSGLSSNSYGFYYLIALNITNRMINQTLSNNMINSFSNISTTDTYEFYEFRLYMSLIQTSYTTSNNLKDFSLLNKANTPNSFFQRNFIANKLISYRSSFNYEDGNWDPMNDFYLNLNTIGSSYMITKTLSYEYIKGSPTFSQQYKLSLNENLASSIFQIYSKEEKFQMIPSPSDITSNELRYSISPLSTSITKFNSNPTKLLSLEIAAFFKSNQNYFLTNFQTFTSNIESYKDVSFVKAMDGNYVLPNYDKFFEVFISDNKLNLGSYNGRIFTIYSKSNKMNRLKKQFSISTKCRNLIIKIYLIGTFKNYETYIIYLEENLRSENISPNRKAPTIKFHNNKFKYLANQYNYRTNDSINNKDFKFHSKEKFYSKRNLQSSGSSQSTTSLEDYNYSNYQLIYTEETAASPDTVENSNIDLTYQITILPINDLFYTNKRNFSDYNSSSTSSAEDNFFNPSFIPIKILIKKITTNLVLFNKADSTTNTLGYLYIKQPLFPVSFKDVESINLQLSKFTTVISLSLEEQNFLTFSSGDVNKFDLKDSNIFNHYPFPSAIAYLSSQLNIRNITNCAQDEIFTLIKTNLRDLDKQNMINEEIKFSVYETKAIFLINKFCFDLMTNKTFYTISSTGIRSTDTLISNNILKLDIQNFENIVFEFSFILNDLVSYKSIKAKKETIFLASPYFSIGEANVEGVRRSYYLAKKRNKINGFKYKINYETTTLDLIHDKVDLLNTCYVTVIQSTEELSIGNNKNFNDCFEGFFVFGSSLSRTVSFKIQYNSIKVDKTFNFILGFGNNTSINFNDFTNATSYEDNSIGIATSESNNNFENLITINIARTEATNINSIKCFKSYSLRDQVYNALKDTFIPLTFNSEKSLFWEITKLNTKEDDVYFEIFKNNNLVNATNSVLQKAFNFLDSSKNFTFDKSFYDNKYKYYNASLSILCQICYYTDSFCFEYKSNVISRKADIDTNITNDNPKPTPIPFPNPTPDGDPIPSFSDDKTTNKTQNNTGTDSSINKNNTTNDTIIDNQANNKTQINNSTDSNDINNKTPEIIDIPKSINVTVNPLKNDTVLINNYTKLNPEEKAKKLEDYQQDLIKDIEKNKGFNISINASLAVISMQKTITLNNLISNTNCSSFKNETECQDKLKQTQVVIVESLTRLLNCSEIFKIFFGVENPSETILISALSLYYSSSNINLFTPEKMLKIKELNECLIKASPDLLKKMSNNTLNNTKTELIKNDYLNVITSTTSNLISITKNNLKDKLNNMKSANDSDVIDVLSPHAKYDDYKNGSLIITLENVQVKNLIEENAVMLMKMKLQNDIINNNYKNSNDSSNSTSSNNSSSDTNNFINNNTDKDTQNNGSQFTLKTNNFNIYSKIISVIDKSLENITSTNVTSLSKKRFLKYLEHVDFFRDANFENYKFKSNRNFTKSNKFERRVDDYEMMSEPLKVHNINKGRFLQKHFRRFLQEKYEVIKINDNDIDIRIHMPVDYLFKNINKDLNNYGIIQYKKYPLLSPENKNFSENVISINLYDKNFSNIKIENLTKPIEIFIKKPNKNFKNCLFVDTNDYKWNNKGCETTDLGTVLLCSCNHLTDFSIAKYDPVLLINDMLNVLEDIWLISDFEAFKILNYKNATIIYIFGSILIIYLIGLIFTVRYDNNDEYDAFVYEVERNYSCCSKTETLENIKEVKKMSDEAEEERLKISLKLLEQKLEKFKMDNIIAKAFHLDVIIPDKKLALNNQMPLDESNKTNASLTKGINNDFDNDNANNYPEHGKKLNFFSQYIRRNKKTLAMKSINNITNSNANETSSNGEITNNTNNKTNNGVNALSEATEKINIEMKNLQEKISTNENNKECVKDAEIEEEITEKTNKKSFLKNLKNKEKNKLINEISQRASGTIKSLNIEEDYKYENSVLFKNKENVNSNNNLNVNPVINQESDLKIIDLGFTNDKKNVAFPASLYVNRKNLKNIGNNNTNNITNNKSNSGYNINQTTDQNNSNSNFNEDKEEIKNRSASGAKQFTNKIFIEGLKVKIQNFTLSHKDFIANLYNNSANDEVKKEIEKFFVIKKPKKSKLKNFVKQAKSLNDTKLANLNKMFIDTKDFSSESFTKNKTIDYSVNDDIENNVTNFKLNPYNQANHNIESFDNTSTIRKTEDLSCASDEAFTTKQSLKLINNEIVSNKCLEQDGTAGDKEGEAEAQMKVELKNAKLLKFFRLLIYFFKTEYRLINIFVRQFNVVNKTGMWSLICFRLIASLLVAAMLTPQSSNDQKSSTGYVYNNRDFAVAILTIFIIEIPFSFIESYISKRKVFIGWSEEKKLYERKLAIRYCIMTYVFLFLMYVFGLINTTWISLRMIINNKNNPVYKNFLLATIFDYFVFEVIILCTKSIIYFLLIKNENLPCWKRFLISFVSAMPWAFAMFG